MISIIHAATHVSRLYIMQNDMDRELSPLLLLRDCARDWQQGTDMARQKKKKKRPPPPPPHTTTAEPDLASSASLQQSGEATKLPPTLESEPTKASRGDASTPPPSSTLAMTMTIPTIKEVRDGIINPYYDHSELARPLRGISKVYYYVVTFPIAIMRMAMLVACLASYLAFMLASLPLVLLLRRWKARSDTTKLSTPVIASLGRTATQLIDSLMYKLLMTWPGKLCGFVAIALGVGFRVKVKGEQNLRAAWASGRPFVCVSNHVSYFDVAVLCRVIGPFSAVAKADIRGIPLVGWVAIAWGCFFLNRTTRSPEMVAKLNASLSDRAKKMGPAFMQPPLLIFPEGTTTNGDNVAGFRLGAFRTGADVLPITINYDTGKFVRRAWSPPYDGTEHFFRIVGTWHKSVEVTVLPMQTRCEETNETPDAMALRVQRQMAESIGVPAATAWSLKDALAFYKTQYSDFGESEKKAGGEKQEQGHARDAAAAGSSSSSSKKAQ